MLRAALILLLAVAAAPAALAQDPPAAPPAFDPVETARFGSVVVFDGSKDPGTGFIVSTEGHIVTAWHVIANLEEHFQTSTGLYLPHLFTVHINNRDHADCKVRAELVGASEPQDIAVLQIAPDQWREKKSNACLKPLSPVNMTWSEADLDTALKADPTIALVGIRAQCWKDSKQNNTDKWACLDSENRSFTEVSLAGNLVTSEAPYTGMSGGIAIHPTGKVIGIIIQGTREGAAGQGTNVRTVIKPITSLRRAFWTFGIVPDETMRDYVTDLQAILAKSETIAKLVDLYPMLIDEINTPVWAKEPSLTPHHPAGGDSVAFEFKKKSPLSSDPAYFEVVRKCKPPDVKLAQGSDPGGAASGAQPVGFLIPKAGSDAVIRAEAQPYGSYIYVPPYNPEAAPADRPPHYRGKPDGGMAKIVSGTLTGLLQLTASTEQIRQECAFYFNEIARNMDQADTWVFSKDDIQEVTFLIRSHFSYHGVWRYSEGGPFDVSF